MSSLSDEAAKKVRAAFSLADYCWSDDDYNKASPLAQKSIKVGNPSWGKVGAEIFQGLSNHYTLNDMAQCPDDGATREVIFRMAWDDDILEQARILGVVFDDDEEQDAASEALGLLSRRTWGLVSNDPDSGYVYAEAIKANMLLCEWSGKVGGVAVTYKWLTQDEDVAYTYRFRHVLSSLDRAMKRVGRQYQPVLDVFPGLEKRARREIAAQAVEGKKALEARTSRAITKKSSAA
jgi:hypothetical protein